MDTLEENYVNFSTIYHSLTILEKEYLIKLHEAKQEEINNKLIQDENSKSYKKGLDQKDFEKQLPFEMTTKVKDLYDNYVYQYDDSKNNLLNSNNFINFLDQLENNTLSSRKESFTEKYEEKTKYEPYKKRIVKKTITYDIDLHDVQKKWLERYVGIGDQKLEVVQENQSYLERNIFSRLWNRQKIINNRSYISNLSTTLKDIEWQQSNYLHSKIEIKAHSELERESVKLFTEKVNEYYGSKINELISSVTLLNYDSSTEQYNQIKSELYSLSQSRFNNHDSFPSYIEIINSSEVSSYNESINSNLKQYVSDVTTAINKGDTKVADNNLNFLDQMTIEELEEINNFLDDCENEYRKDVNLFVRDFDKDNEIVDLAISKIEDYKISDGYIEKRKEQELLREFDQFYLNCSSRQKDYLHGLNNMNLEIRDNIDILKKEDKSYIYKNELLNEFEDISLADKEVLRSAFNQYITNDSLILNQNSFHSYTEELNSSYDTNYDIPNLDPYEVHYSTSDIDKLEQSYMELKESEDRVSDINQDTIYEGKEEVIENYYTDDDELNELDLENTETHNSTEITEKQLSEVQSPFQDATINTVEKELQQAINSGDNTAIIQSRARINELKMQQLIQQGNLLREQQDQRQSDESQEEKESVIDDYMEYLRTGYLSADKLEKLVSFDKKLTDFEKIDFRLEAIERIKIEYPEGSFNRYKELLESVHTDYDKLDQLLGAEYDQISKNISVKNNLITSEQTMDRILE